MVVLELLELLEEKSQRESWQCWRRSGGEGYVQQSSAQHLCSAVPKGCCAQGMLCPTAEDGLKGMSFIDACVRSDRAEGRWTEVA